MKRLCCWSRRMLAWFRGTSWDGHCWAGGPLTKNTQFAICLDCGTTWEKP